MDATTRQIDSVQTDSVPGAEAEFRLGYRRWLDGLRGVAVVAVLAFHFSLLPGGSLGVDIFFVLSGFLITVLLLTEWRGSGSIKLGNFYARRALRLLPAFFVLLALCGIGTAFLGDVGSLWEILVAACYVANWPSLHHTQLPRLGHTWTLSIEEQFYLVWPVLLILLLRSGLSRKKMAMVVCVGIIASASLRIVLYRLYPVAGPEKSANVMRLYMGSDTRADALLVGCLAAMLVTWKLVAFERMRRGLRVGAAAGAVVLGYLLWNRTLDHSQYYNGLFTVAAALVAVIIVHMLQAPSRAEAALLEFAPLVVLGKLSYGLYLYHIPIIAWMKPSGLGWRHPWPTLQVAAASLAAACVSYVLIERPFLALKRRFEAPAQTTEHPKQDSCDAVRTAA